ncbi:hypothetical protein [Bradyrhizobium iriomotense]|uniref:Uncharacterized protein n=1 Tax=Bradyrhizobium iriomotense TaxID=441950 RepID=A0ABQ6BBE0_9BRAD|nr:hypothetical protein [Bradyrhizobium iriomotense]GLR91672.1 hypothetical protein GCM10007857_83900 [Bradyrhizobium iriomotense]
MRADAGALLHRRGSRVEWSNEIGIEAILGGKKDEHIVGETHDQHGNSHQNDDIDLAAIELDTIASMQEAAISLAGSQGHYEQPIDQSRRAKRRHSPMNEAPSLDGPMSTVDRPLATVPRRAFDGDNRCRNS